MHSRTGSDTSTPQPALHGQCLKSRLFGVFFCGSVGGKLILPHAAKAAYWGCSVLSEVNLEKSFEVQSDSCIKPLLENKEP